MMTSRTTWVVAVALAGCTSSSIPAVRFANAPPVAVVDDRLDVPHRPSNRMFLSDLYHYDGTFQGRITRALDVPRARRALGVNSLDEVPDSTWFTNRIGIRALTVDEIRNGPISIDSPELHKPWTVRSSKVGGTSIGFIIKDARGEKFVIKFDQRPFPEVETAADVIVNRMLWAAGYNVSEDQIVYFRREELLIAPDAEIKDAFGGNKARLDSAELDRQLAFTTIGPDGRIRAMASRWLDGQAIGGPPAEGVRKDDPNDRIPHELRRDLRGARPIFAWLDDVDVQEGNFVDTWIADPRDSNRHYVKHFLIDSGKSLGAMTTIDGSLRSGFEYVVDFSSMAKSLVSAGTFERPWESRATPTLRGVAALDVASFDPAAWRPGSPAYLPFLDADRFDRFWGAKLMMRFTRDQIHAAVEAGRLSDPRAVEYLTGTLVGRQRATALYAFEHMNPLDSIVVTPSSGGGAMVCFDDLMLSYRLSADLATTRYVVKTYGRDGRAIGTAFQVRADASARTCAGSVALAKGDGYTIVRIETIRPHFAAHLDVHVARDPAGVPRVIGLWRP